MQAGLGILQSIERIVLGALLLFMVALYVAGIAIRELIPDFARNVAWIDEGARYMMVWLVFLSLGLALSEGRQIAMTSFAERMPAGARLWLGRIIDLTGFVFSLFIVWAGLEIAAKVGATGQRSPTLGISTAILYYPLPIGFALLAFRYALSFFGVIDRFSKSETGH